MSDYTVELRNIADWPRLQQVLAAYPLHDADTKVTGEITRRDELNAKIMAHYWVREIGFETAELFTQRLHSRLMLIMPPYNELLESARVKLDDVLVTTDLETSTDSTSASTSNAKQSTTSDTESRAGQYEHPQTQLAPEGTRQGDYQSSEARSLGTTSTAGDNVDTSAGRVDTLTRMRGRSGSAALLLNEYRSTILNVDQMIVDDLAVLFMGVWQPMRRSY